MLGIAAAPRQATTCSRQSAGAPERPAARPSPATAILGWSGSVVRVGRSASRTYHLADAGGGDSRFSASVERDGENGATAEDHLNGATSEWEISALLSEAQGNMLLLNRSRVNALEEAEQSKRLAAKAQIRAQEADARALQAEAKLAAAVAVPPPLPAAPLVGVKKFVLKWTKKGTSGKVMGSFDNWTSGVQMRACADGGGLETELYAYPGGNTILYKFVIDGNWLVDDKSPQATSATGSVNNVLAL